MSSNNTTYARRKRQVKNVTGYVGPLLMNRPIILKSCVNVADILFQFLGILDPKYSMPGSVTRLGLFGTLDAIRIGLDNSIMLLRGYGVRGNLARRMIPSTFRPTKIEAIMSAGFGMSVLQSFDGFWGRATSISFSVAQIASNMTANTTRVMRAPNIATKVWSSGSFLYNMALLITLIGGFIATIDTQSTQHDLQTIFVVLHIIKAGVTIIISQLQFLSQRFNYRQNSLRLCPTNANTMERRVNTTLKSYF